MESSKYLDDSLASIKNGTLEIEYFVNCVLKQPNAHEIIECLRIKMRNDSDLSNVSLYCGLAREFNDGSFLDVLWTLLRNPETKGRRASIVYAMENMNPIQYLEDLVDLAIHEGFEVLSNVILTIEELDGHVESEIIERCIEKINFALSSDMPEWRRDALEFILRAIS